MSGPKPKPSPSSSPTLSSWTPLLLRASAVVVALFALAWIGRTAAAGPSTVPLADALDAASLAAPVTVVVADAGAPPVLEAPPVLTPPPAPAPGGGSRARATPAEPVYLNHAGIDELRRLPGVGPKRAEAILVLRQRIGRFGRVEDLLRVKGVGRGAVKKWRPLVRLDAPPATGASNDDAGSP